MRPNLRPTAPGRQRHTAPSSLQASELSAAFWAGIQSRRNPHESLKTQKIVTEDRFLAEGDRQRFTLLGENEDFFRQLLAGRSPIARSGGQRRLSAAWQRISDLASQLAAAEPHSVLEWIDGIGQLNVLEFLEEDEGSAIRIFETVNDRGRPLATIDKIKSFLIYVSNRYLSGALDSPLQVCFGRIFHAFDRAKEIGGKDLGVTLVAADGFTEDQVLRYHFLAYPSEYHDYKLATDEILATFLKGTVRKSLRDSAALLKFIGEYAADLAEFFEAFSTLMERASQDVRYYKLLALLAPSTRLYPLLVRLGAMGLLEAPLFDGAPRTFLDLIELTELRVYKTGRAHAQKDMACVARDAKSQSARITYLTVIEFVARYQGDLDFKSSLSGAAYERNEALSYILLEFEERHRAATSRPALTHKELRDLKAKEPTIDHILAKSPSFSWASRGFKDEEHFDETSDRIGNLALVEKSINSAAQEKSPEQKSKVSSLYQASAYVSTRHLGATLMAASQKGDQFGLKEIEARSTELVDFCLSRWSLAEFLDPDLGA